MALKQKGKITKDRLLAIGTEQMLRASYDSVGIQSITQQAKLPKASFYYYFKSKEEFCVQLFQNYMQSYYQTNVQFLDVDQNPGCNAMQRLEMLYRHSYESHRQNDWKIPCLFMKIAVEVNSKSEAVRQVIAEWIDRIVVLHQQVVRDGLEDGSMQIPQAFSAEVFGELVFNQWKGAVILSDVQRSGLSLDHFFTFLHALCRCRCPHIDEI